MHLEPLVRRVFSVSLSTLKVIFTFARPAMDTNTDSPPKPPPAIRGSPLQDSKGWDGKMRVERRAVVTNAEILSDPEYSDEDAPPLEQINADEGQCISTFSALLLITARQTYWRTMNLIVMYAGRLHLWAFSILTCAPCRRLILSTAESRPYLL